MRCLQEEESCSLSPLRCVEAFQHLKQQQEVLQQQQMQSPPSQQQEREPEGQQETPQAVWLQQQHQQDARLAGLYTPNSSCAETAGERTAAAAPAHCCCSSCVTEGHNLCGCSCNQHQPHQPEHYWQLQHDEDVWEQQVPQAPVNRLQQQAPAHHVPSCCPVVPDSPFLIRQQHKHGAGSLEQRLSTLSQQVQDLQARASAGISAEKGLQQQVRKQLKQWRWEECQEEERDFQAACAADLQLQQQASPCCLHRSASRHVHHSSSASKHYHKAPSRHTKHGWRGDKLDDASLSRGASLLLCMSAAGTSSHLGCGSSRPATGGHSRSLRHQQQHRHSHSRPHSAGAALPTWPLVTTAVAASTAADPCLPWPGSPALSSVSALVWSSPQKQRPARTRAHVCGEGRVSAPHELVEQSAFEAESAGLDAETQVVAAAVSCTRAFAAGS